MKWLAIALVAAGCLSEPDAPIGHRYELRDAVLVADLDGDGKDDLVTWGHDGDPRKTSEVFIRWGMGEHHLHEKPDQTISISAWEPTPFHEVVAVAFARHQSPPELLVLAGDDEGLPPDGQTDRRLQLWHVAITGRSLGNAKASFSTALQAYALGGYTRAPGTIFLAPYETPAGMPRVILGGAGGRVVEGALSGDVTDFPLALNANEGLEAVVPVPPGSSSQQQDLLFITTKRVVKGQPSSLQAGTPLPPRGGMTASAREIGGALWIAAVEPYAEEVSIIKIDDNDSPLEVYDAMATIPVASLSIAAFDYNTGAMGLVTANGDGFIAQPGLDTSMQPVGFDASVGPVASDGESVLAVGDWDGTDDSIMVFDATDKTHAAVCRYYGSGNTLNGC